MGLVSDADVDAALSTLPGWRRAGPALERTVEAASFLGAVDLVNRIAHVAEARAHHPDLGIRYRTLRITLTTHDAGGVTERDLQMAQALQTLLEGV